MGRKRKSRREYGQGTVTANRRINRYVVRWYEDGQQRSCSRFALTPEGKAAAEAYLAEQNKNANKPQDTLADWLAEALKVKKMTNRASTMTANRYASMLIVEEDVDLVDTPIVNIKPADIMAFYSKLQSKHRRNTIKMVHVMLRAAFQQAKANGVIQRNIMVDVTVPKNKQKEPLEILTWKDLGRIFHFLRHRKRQYNQDWYLFFRLLYVLGCRVGELQALKWTDVDWERRDIHVQRTVSGQNNNTITPTKTAAGDRFVPVLSDSTFKLLIRAYDKSKDKDGYIFATRKTGKPVTYGTLYRIWLMCNINKKIHCIRHTRASDLISAGLPIPDVSRMLGHANPAVTLGIYAHAIPRYTDSLKKSYQDIVSSKKPQKS